MPSVPATYYDGVVSRRIQAEISLHPDGLAIFGPDGRRLDLWPYAEIRRIEGHAGAGLAVTRLPPAGSRAEPLLEIGDPAVAGELAARAPLTLTKGVAERRERRMVVVWAVAAIVAVLGVAFLGLPAIAQRLAPLVPATWEARLGDAIDPEIRSMFRDRGGFGVCAAGPGQEALADLVGRFERAADLHLPLKVAVVRHRLVNAIALPGGRIYIFQGLIERARSPDELAGVLAHEIGHVRYRHGLRSAIQAGGLGLLLGTVFGDFAGGTAIVLASRTLMSSAFSRDAEREADAFAVDLMLKAGGDPMGLARFFESLEGSDPGLLAWIASHPANAERIAAIRAATGEATRRASAMTPERWAALRSICARVETSDATSRHAPQDAG